MKLKEVELRREISCASCPETWDFFLGETCVGYSRLRWGSGRVSYYPETGDCQVLFTYSLGDGMAGSFDDDKQREKILRKAERKILKRLRRDGRLSHLGIEPREKNVVRLEGFMLNHEEAEILLQLMEDSGPETSEYRDLWRRVAESLGEWDSAVFAR